MAKLTITQIKQQIAALEAKAQRLVAHEMKASVAKVRALMDSLGVTIEHLGEAVGKKTSGTRKATAVTKAAPRKRPGAGIIRYRDPATGATWTGFGRAPAWIASATNREEFLVGLGTLTSKRAASAVKRRAKLDKDASGNGKEIARASAKPKPVAKKTSAAKKVTTSPKTLTKKGESQGAKTSPVKAAARKGSEKKALARQPASKKASARAVAVEAPPVDAPTTN